MFLGIVLVLICGILYQFGILQINLSSGEIIASNENADAVIVELRKIFPDDRLFTKKYDIVPFSTYKCVETIGNPDAVVFPESVDEVINIITICDKFNMIVIPMGLNTAVEGQTVTSSGGVVINMVKMNKVLSVHPNDYQVTVEPGIRVQELNDELKKFNLFFPVHPSSNPSLGGVVGTSGSGMLTPKFLTIKENVISLEAVLPNGKLIKTGRRSVKSSAGYDLASLLIGSEGTLGIVTKLVVRAVPIPNELAAATVAFSTNHGASDAVVKLMGKVIELGISRMEMINKPGIVSLNAHMGTKHPESPAIFIEFFGESDSDVSKKLEKTERICNEFGGHGFQSSRSEEENKILWKTRMSAFYAFSNCREDCVVDGKKKPSCKLFATDYCVPISQLGELVEYCDDLFERMAPKLSPNLVVHAGCANLHHGVLVDFSNPDEVELMEKMHLMMIQKTIELDGTIAGEHGIGLKMKKFLGLEFGEDTLEVMRKIKKAIDPKNMMNPGKIL